MKILKLASIWAVLLMLLTACDNSSDGSSAPDVGEDIKENLTTTVKVSVQNDDLGDSLEGLSIHSILDEAPLVSSNQDLASVYNDLPQLYFIADKEERIIMLSRQCVNEGGQVTIDAESTAMALVTFNPLFANITQKDYQKIELMVKSTNSFASLLEVVKQSIKQQKELFDENNTELLVALSNVLDEICENVNKPKNLSQPIFSRASEITGINPDPVLVQAEGNTVIIRNKGLIPTYECSVYYGGKMVSSQLVQSHSSYGFLSPFDPIEDFYYGEPCEFYLQSEGEYRFYLDRLTDDAINDFSCRLWSDVLSMIGLYNCGDILEYSATAISTIGSLVVDPSTDVSDVILAVSGIFFDIGVNMKWKDFGKVLGKFNVVYNVIKGFANEMTRVILGFTAPFDIDFCLCLYQNSITCCTKAELSKVEGDNQQGFGGQRLLKPLTVLTKVISEDGTEMDRATYQKVKFEVVSGGGSVGNEIVGTEAGSGLASTYWTIGTEGEQKVKAVVVDMVTGVEVSEPVFFTATLREEADLTVRLDWNKLSGNTDIDLHVTDPFGEEIYYGHMASQSGGWLDWDDVVGPGPEHICWTKAPAGTYLVQVHYFGSESRAVTNYRVTINVNGENYGPFTGSIGYHQLVTIGKVTLPEVNATRSNGFEPVFNKYYEVQENIVFSSPKTNATEMNFR